MSHRSWSAFMYIVVNLKHFIKSKELFPLKGGQETKWFWEILLLCNSVTPLKRQEESALRHDKVFKEELCQNISMPAMAEGQERVDSLAEFKFIFNLWIASGHWSQTVNSRTAEAEYQ